jgi:hypothetical protein
MHLSTPQGTDWSPQDRHDSCSSERAKHADSSFTSKIEFSVDRCHHQILVPTMARSRSPARRRRAPTTAAAETPLPPTPKSGGRSATTTAAAAATPAPLIKQARNEDETWGPEAGVWSQRGPA